MQIKEAFEIGKYEITQAQWQAVMAGKNPGSIEGADFPVDTVGWHDIQVFLKKLNARNDGHRYKLPTAEQWQYAALSVEEK